MIRVTSNADQVKAAINQMKNIEKRIPKAFSSALNRTGQGLKTEAVKMVTGTYDVKAKDVRPTIRLTKSQAGNLQLEMISKGKNIPLIRFRTKPKNIPKRKPKVLVASVKRSGGKPIPGAFITRVGGHVGVLTRVGVSRLPIRELYGPSVPVMLGNERVSNHLEKEARKRMKIRLDHEIARQLKGAIK